MKSLNSYIARDVRNRKFLKLMKDAGLDNIILCKGDGYYWITSDDDATYNIIDSLPETTIYINSFNQQTPEQWVEDIKQLLANARS